MGKQRRLAPLSPIGAILSQHFLLSAAARDISLFDVSEMSEQEAIDYFAKIRWGRLDEQACPHCGVIDQHRYVRLQKRWRCRHCYAGFSVTSGTVFHNHKLPLKKILEGVVLYANVVKGISALQMARDLDVQHKTAFVLLHKIRESLLLSRDADKMSGTVEVDGGYMHTYVRPKRLKSERKDLRLAESQNPNKCVILVLRERHSNPRRGAKRTRTFILPSENQRDIRAIVMANVLPGTRIISDEANGYATLGTHWEHEVVVHAEEFSSATGANENQAESYIARFRRLMMGQIHRLNRKYLDVYANEVGVREDHRRVSNGNFVEMLMQKGLHRPPSRDWTGYWQGNKRNHDSVQTFS